VFSTPGLEDTAMAIPKHRISAGSSAWLAQLRQLETNFKKVEGFRSRKYVELRDRGVQIGV
jgi:hypothetical protein